VAPCLQLAVLYHQHPCRLVQSSLTFRCLGLWQFLFYSALQLIQRLISRYTIPDGLLSADADAAQGNF
jgi:hypothetical protein